MATASIYQAPEEVETDPDEAIESDEPTEPYDQLPSVGEAVRHLYGGGADPDILNQLINANRKFKEQESEVDELKADLKAAKEEMDGSARLISRLISALENDEDRPLFKSLDNPVAIEDSTWKANTIDELDDLSPGIRTCLRQADVATLGELADLIARVENGGDMPKGLGPKKWDQVLASLNTWHDNNGAVDSASVPVSDPEWEAMSDKKKDRYLQEQAKIVGEWDIETLEESYRGIGGGEPMAAGAEAFKAGETILNCELPPGAEQDAWIAGFVWAEKEGE